VRISFSLAAIECLAFLIVMSSIHAQTDASVDKRMGQDGVQGSHVSRRNSLVGAHCTDVSGG